MTNLEKLLAEAAEIADERRMKAAESHVCAMAARNAMPPGNAMGWQMASDYALRTARVLDQTAVLARKVIAAEKLAGAASNLVNNPGWGTVNYTDGQMWNDGETLISALAEWSAAQ